MKQRERKLTIIAAVVAGLLLLDRLLLGPFLGAWESTGVRLRAQRSELAFARQLIRREDTLRARARTVVAPTQVEPGIRANDFLGFVHGAAQRSRLTIASEKPSIRVYGRRGGETPVYAESSLSLTFTCSMEELVRFLAELAAGDQPVRVVALQLTGLDPGGRALKVTLALSTVALVEEGGNPRQAQSPDADPGAPS